jgi:CRP-like cAMP-binding protein
MSRDPKIDVLRKVPLFADANDATLKRVASLADDIDLPAGKVIITQGSTGQEFFVVIDGQVAVERDGQRIATLGPGDFLGEIALVDDRPRSATATLETPSRLLVIGHREFHSLLDQFPDIQLEILRALAARVRRLQPEAP